MLAFCTTLIDDQSDVLRFEQIYYAYRKQMLCVALEILHDPHDAEDAVQNALVGIARHISAIPYRSEKVLRVYVLTAAKNAALNLLPQKKRRDSMQDISGLNLPSPDDPFERVVNCQDYELLLRAISQLEEPYREVLTLCYVHDHGPKATARILSRGEATVRKQLYRGKKQLLELCRKEGLDLG